VIKISYPPVPFLLGYIFLGIFGFVSLFSSGVLLYLLRFIVFSRFITFLFVATLFSTLVFLLRSFDGSGGDYPITYIIIFVAALFYSVKLQSESLYVSNYAKFHSSLVLLIATFVISSFFTVYDFSTLSFLGFFYDRNLFALILLPFILYIAWRFKYGVLIALLLAIMTGSRNAVLAVLVTSIFVHVQFLQFFVRKYSAFSIVVFICLPIVVLYGLSFVKELFDVENGRQFFSILDASNLERSQAMFASINFLMSNTTYLFLGGGWLEYSDLVATRVHNDFIAYVIKHGLLVSMIFFFTLIRAYKFIKLPIAVLLGYIVFSSILGGIAWGGGLYWIGVSFLLYGIEKNVRDKRRWF